MKAEISTLIQFHYSCDNKDIDPFFIKKTKEEYVEMLKEELKKYLTKEIEDEELKIINIETDIEYIDDIPKENK